MRLRTVKPGFFKNEALAEVPPLGRILFEGLWCMADREGLLEDRPKRIKAEVLPYDDCDVDALLDDLAGRHFILRYEAGGERYIWVVKFRAHQFPNKREAKSTLPPPSEAQALTALTVKTRDFHGESTGLSQDLHSGISVTPLLRYSVSPLPPCGSPLAGGTPPQDETTTQTDAEKEKPEPEPDRHTPGTSAPKATSTTPAPRQNKSATAPSLTAEQRAKLVAKWAPVLDAVSDRIDAALNHVAVKKAISTERYVDNWLRNDANKVPPTMAMRRGAASLSPVANGHGPQLPPLDPDDPEWLEQGNERERQRQAARYSTGGG